MARIPFVGIDEVPDRFRHLAGDGSGRMMNSRRALLNHPELLGLFVDTPQWFRTHSTLPPRLRELVLLQIGYVTGSSYEFSHHVVIAATAGVTDDDVLAMIAETAGASETATPDRFSNLECAALRAGRDLTRHLDIDDATWAHLVAGLGETTTMELVVLIAHYNLFVRVLAALQVDVEPEYRRHLRRYEPFDPVVGWR